MQVVVKEVVDMVEDVVEMVEEVEVAIVGSHLERLHDVGRLAGAARGVPGAGEVSTLPGNQGTNEPLNHIEPH